MQPPKHIVIIAGEASGDLHAANFVRKLNQDHPNIVFSGIGGTHLQDAGVQLISDLARYGVTGLTELFGHFQRFRHAFKAIKVHLKTTKPDLLILVDFPGFNLRLLKYAKHVLNLRILYYISPQIWAWKPKRINLIRECVDWMAVILPFEKKLYEAAGIPVSFVGHPLVNEIPDFIDIPAIRQNLGLPQKTRVIAMLPGSRVHEIERHMPVLINCAQQLLHDMGDLHFVIPVANTIDTAFVNAYFVGTTIPYTLVQGQTVAVAACSDCVVVASGTASLECALLEKPMCIIYKASLLTYIAASQLIRVKYLGLCNLLQNEMIVPELLQYDCNPHELTRAIKSLLTDQEMIHLMQTRLNRLKTSLSSQKADDSICDLITELMLKFG